MKNDREVMVSWDAAYQAKHDAIDEVLRYRELLKNEPQGTPSWHTWTFALKTAETKSDTFDGMAKALEWVMSNRAGKIIE